MTVFADIKGANETRLSGMVGLPAVAWENTGYEPVVGTLYLRPTMLPAQTVSGLGDTAQDYNSGIFQIDVFAQANQGSEDAMVMADLIADRFKKGTSYTYGVATVRVESVSIQAARTDSGWYHLPVIVNYFSFTQART